MITLGPGLSYIDLQFQNAARVIATGVLHGEGGAALIDPGPSSTLPALRSALDAAGLAIGDLTAVLLTHIHLDHAGATGTLVRENPALRVYVHETGARHLIDPAALIASATRLWGDEMDRLWGEMRPVPGHAIVPLAGGERIDAVGRGLDVAYTPGHASHHVSYFSRETGIAFVGDAAGVCLLRNGFVMPPTPPPDVDLAAWQGSLSAIGAWAADTLFLTHFGPHAPAAPHLAELADHLEMASELVRKSLAREGTDHDRETWFTDEMRALLQRRVSAGDAKAYEVAGRFDLNWRGLARYWRKRA